VESRSQGAVSYLLSFSFLVSMVLTARFTRRKGGKKKKGKKRKHVLGQPGVFHFYQLDTCQRRLGHRRPAENRGKRGKGGPFRVTTIFIYNISLVLLRVTSSGRAMNFTPRSWAEEEGGKKKAETASALAAGLIPSRPTCLIRGFSPRTRHRSPGRKKKKKEVQPPRQRISSLIWSSTPTRPGRMPDPGEKGKGGDTRKNTSFCTDPSSGGRPSTKRTRGGGKKKKKDGEDPADFALFMARIRRRARRGTGKKGGRKKKGSAPRAGQHPVPLCIPCRR